MDVRILESLSDLKIETNDFLFAQNYTVSPSECNISILIYGNELRFRVFAIFFCVKR